MRQCLPLFLTSLFLFLLQFSNAQVENKKQEKNNIMIGIQTGATYAFPYKYKTLYTVPAAFKAVPVPFKYVKAPCQLEYQIDCMLGVSFQTNISNRLVFRTELNYERLKKCYWNASEVINFNGQAFNGSFKYVSSYEFISLPILFKFKLFNPKNITIYGDAGVFANYWFRTYTQGECDGNSISFAEKENMTYSGTLTGIGIDKKLDAKIHFIAEIRDYFTVYENLNGFYFDNTCRFLIGFSYCLHPGS